MKKRLTFLLGLCLLLLLTAFVQPLTPAAALERFFTEEEVQPDWFAEDFLAQVPLAQITELRQQVTDQLGAFQGIEGDESLFTVSFAGGNVTAEIVLDEAGQITGLQITPAESAPAPTPADPDITPQAALERLFTRETIEETWFSDAFLAAVPLTQIEGLLAQAKQAGGALQQVAGASSPFTLRFTTAQTTAEITLDNTGRIIGLFIQPLIPRVDTLDAAMEQFAALPGDVSVLVREDGEELAALNADALLGIGSAFKLAILTALSEQIDAGEHTWDEVVTLDPALKSLPGGMIQDWPDGSPLTIHTLATLMISISDNTATDVLLHLVGREVVEEYAGDNRPLLSTKELFKLKATPNADLLEQYLTGDEAEKRAVLDQLAALPLPAPAAMPGGPTLDVEWFFTPGELCDLMAGVQDLDLMTVSPGVANPAEWAHVAFKGGSEIGVLNLTHWLETEDGTAYCVVVTQNRADAAVDETLLSNLTRATIGLLGPSLPITNSTGLTATGTLTATAPTTNTGSLTATTAPTATETTTETGTMPTTAPLVFANVRLFDGEMVITATNVVVEDLTYRGSNRRGYTVLPGAGAQPGEEGDPFAVADLLQFAIGSTF